MRVCRRCGREFKPERAYYFWCSWTCRIADKRGGDAPGDPYRRGYDAGYRDGMANGQRQGSLPPAVWRGLLRVAHPDRYQGSPLEGIAHDVTIWLLANRPPEEGHA
jgi:hypothetical protein